MRRRGTAGTREVRAVFELDRLAQESLERAYARLVPLAHPAREPAVRPAQQGQSATTPKGGAR